MAVVVDRACTRVCMCVCSLLYVTLSVCLFACCGRAVELYRGEGFELYQGYRQSEGVESRLLEVHVTGAGVARVLEGGCWSEKEEEERSEVQGRVSPERE